MKLTSIVAAGLAVTTTTLPLRAALKANIDLEGSPTSTILSNWDLNENGVIYIEKNLDRNNVQIPWIGASWGANTSARCLRFTHNPLPASSPLEKQRTEYYGARNLPFYQNHYIGFQFTFVGTAADLQNWAVISQSQQQGFYTNPFAGLVLLKEGNDLMVGLHIRNDNYRDFRNDLVEPPRFGPYFRAWTQTIVPGAWNRIVMRNYPNPYGGGVVQIWWNNVLVYTYNGKLGYTPGVLNGGFTNFFQNTFGIYRGKQNTTFKVYFDDYKVGDSYSEVAN